MNVTNPEQIISDFEKLLQELTESKEPQLMVMEKAINLCSLTLLDLRDIVVTRGFETQEEEIHFFKCQKTRVYSKFIYYGTLFKIICRKPVGTSNVLKNYFSQILEAIDKYHNENIEFYQYHKRGLTFLDKKFYTRDNTEIPPNLNSLHFLIDKSFSTMQDCTLSTLLAHDLLTEYIQKELDKLEQTIPASELSEDILFPNVIWTGKKIALVELIYALCSCGVINNGKIEIKRLVGVFEKVFNIDLGDFYHTFNEIRNRKTERTKFLDRLKQWLLKRMDDGDAK
ncbi:RteC domain-containing protein [Maribellus maritimus]|uniref:RteC domain-containing protein n=1 Tax=Maribellus maritimus TaxID=2870838 RepID=UPI001EE9C4D4|nr:RteC domain-containing protein [Maribellus maritimus]MCG6190840.1 RteC domain-containing protein [Maribellus maritimus]